MDTAPKHPGKLARAGPAAEHSDLLESLPPLGTPKSFLALFDSVNPPEDHVLSLDSEPPTSVLYASECFSLPCSLPSLFILWPPSLP